MIPMLAFDEMTFRARPRAALNLPGLCPVCGAEAARSLVFAAGIGRETYHCPEDGDVAYAYGAETRVAQVLADPVAPSHVAHVDVLGEDLLAAAA